MRPISLHHSNSSALHRPAYDSWHSIKSSAQTIFFPSLSLRHNQQDISNTILSNHPESFGILRPQTPPRQSHTLTLLRHNPLTSFPASINSDQILLFLQRQPRNHYIHIKKRIRRIDTSDSLRHLPVTHLQHNTSCLTHTAPPCRALRARKSITILDERTETARKHEPQPEEKSLYTTQTPDQHQVTSDAASILAASGNEHPTCHQHRRLSVNITPIDSKYPHHNRARSFGQEHGIPRDMISGCHQHVYGGSTFRCSSSE